MNLDKKTFVTTVKHPALKAGIKIKQNFKGDNFFKINSTHVSSSYFSETIELWLNKDYIKEVLKLEYTSEQMISFAKYSKNYCSASGVEIAFDRWSKKQGE